MVCDISRKKICSSCSSCLLVQSFPWAYTQTHTHAHTDANTHSSSLLLRNDLAASWMAARRGVALDWSPTLPDCRRLPSHIPSEISGYSPKIICPAECASVRGKEKKWEKCRTLLHPLLYLLAGCFPGFLAKSHESCNAKPCTKAPESNTARHMETNSKACLKHFDMSTFSLQSCLQSRVDENSCSIFDWETLDPQ